MNVYALVKNGNEIVQDENGIDVTAAIGDEFMKDWIYGLEVKVKGSKVVILDLIK